MDSMLPSYTFSFCFEWNVLFAGGYQLQHIESVLAVHDQFLRQNNPLVSSRVLAEKDSTVYHKGRSLLETIAYILGM